MKSLDTKKLKPRFMPLVVVAIFLSLVACDQDPAFVEQEERDFKKNSADANPYNGSGSDGWTDPAAEFERNGDWNYDDYLAKKQREESGRDRGTGSDDEESSAVFQLFDVEQTFFAGVLEPASITVDLPAAIVSQEVVLTRDRSSKSMNFTQPTRSNVSDSFRQGTMGHSRTQTAKQVAQKPLDVLVVIDNSRSMIEEQANLSTKLAPLLEKVADSDWQIGIVTTDPKDGCLQELVQKGDANAAKKFERAIVNAGINGSGNEQGIFQAVRALKDGCGRTKWLRDNSTIAVLIVSDEDNCSDGNDCAGQPDASGDYLINHLKSIRQVGVTARTYGIFWHPNEVCSTAYNKAKIYADVVARTGGTYGSICASDYTPTLKKISADMAVILGQQLVLNETPDPGTLQVYLNGVQTSAYSLNGKVIVFNESPADGTEMSASYSVGRTTMSASYRLSKKPYQSIVDVRINGASVLSNRYSVDATTKELLFSDMPADSAQIQASYSEDVVLTSAFDLSGEVDFGSLNVSVDNQTTTQFDFESSSGKLSLWDVPAPGSRVAIRYVQIGSAKYRYDLSVDGSQPNGLRVSDGSSGAAVSFSYINGAVQIATSEFSEGRILNFTYRNAARDKFSVKLPGTPMAGSVKAIWEGSECVAEKIEVQGNTAILKNCTLPENISKVELSYDNWVDQSTEFKFEASEMQDARPVKWMVYINGKATKNFSRKEKNYIAVKDSIRPGDVIKVVVTMEAMVGKQAVAVH